MSADVLSRSLDPKLMAARAELAKTEVTVLAQLIADKMQAIHGHSFRAHVDHGAGTEYVLVRLI